ncbi:uncharacterized protein LOC134796192 isoform X5 [Cydia splendana]|uniref:uncharacterized protein LOC134796192 isoform X5 n=1 Tax=Cydia splendana TaxID=1100963 RepID=UPI00300D6886
MFKQVMNNNKRKLFILFCILYLTPLSQCKVAHRRNDDVGTNTEQPNSAIADESKGDQPNAIGVDGPEGDQPINEVDGPAGDQPVDEVDGPEVVNGPEGDQPIDEVDGPEEDQPINEVDGPEGDQSINEDDVTKEDQPNSIDADGTNGQKQKLDDPENPNGCWISLNEQSHFAKMSQLEKKYKDVREAYAKAIDTQKFNERMLEALAQRRGIAERALQKFEGNPNVIPAGLNLGTYCMMRMPASVLFFYRLKLRNNTRFTVNFIHNDVEQLTLSMRLSLNDLHLVGEYERALTSSMEPSQLYYRPNKGEVEFLLKDVKYKVEGRYRLLDGRFHIEHIISEIPPMQILMRYSLDSDGKSVPLDPNSLKDYLNRMQTDLDHWLKDYFNDFLMLYEVEEAQKNKQIQEYENERTILLNQFADQVMGVLNGRLREKGPSLIMPDFTLNTPNGMQIKLYDGTVRGLDTMYRRSVTTGKHVGEVRHVNTDIGFSGLKTEYRYDTYVTTGMPPMSGVFVLNSEDISAHMALQVVGYKPSVPDLLFTILGHGKPSLTVEGPASRIIANFKHLLEHQVISIMSSTLIHHILSLSALTKCDPQLPVKDHEEDREKYITEKTITEDYEDDDITTPMEPTNNDDTEMPDNNDNDEPSPDSNDEPTEQPDTEDDQQTEPPDNNDEPTEQPDYTEDDQQTEPPENDDSDEPTEEPQYTEDDSSTEPAYPNDDDSKKPEYAFVRKESVELELPPKDGSEKGESYKIDHNETFSLTKLNNENDGDRKVLAADYDETPKKDYRGEIVKLKTSDGESD